MPKGHKHTKPTREFAELLYTKLGNSISQISRRLGIPEATLKGYRTKGRWIDRKTPPFSLEDLYDMCLHVMFLSLQRLINRPNLETFAGDVLALKNLSVVMKTITEIAPNTRKEVMQGFMRWLITAGGNVDMTFFLKKAQEYHDAYEQERYIPDELKSKKAL